MKKIVIVFIFFLFNYVNVFADSSNENKRIIVGNKSAKIIIKMHKKILFYKLKTK